MPSRDYPISKVILPAEVHPDNDTINIRESIKINLKNDHTAKMTFIMMNPAFAKQNCSDDTVNQLINFTYNSTIKIVNTKESIKNIGQLRILNLFSVYNHCSNKLRDDLFKFRSTNSLGEAGLKKLLDSNNSTIKDVIKNDTDYIVLAWGLPKDINIGLSLYYRQVFEIQNIVKASKLPIFIPQTKNRPYLSKHENPFHPNKKILTGLVKVNINNLNEIIPI